MPVLVFLLVGGAVALVFVAMFGKSVVADTVSFNEEPVPYGDTMTNLEQIVGSIDPMDTETWPTGDKLWNIARAIAMAEGYGAAINNAPTRNRNPGDISDFAEKYGYDPSVLDSKVTTFPTHAAGWAGLRWKLENMANRQSAVYSPDMTWEQFAQKWQTKLGPSWVDHVTNSLGVKPTSTIKEYLG